MPGRPYKHDLGVKVDVIIPSALHARIRESMVADGHLYFADQVRKLLDRGLRFGELKVGHE
jgi:hypothetical protein